MSDADQVSGAENVSALLHLMCPNRHPVGRLLMWNRAHDRIEYNREGQPGPPDRWPLNKTDIYSEPVCPGGCQYEVGELADRLVKKVLVLANDNGADEDTYTLKFLGPPRTSD